MSGAPEQNLVEKIVVPATIHVKRDCGTVQAGRKTDEINGIPAQMRYSLKH